MRRTLIVLAMALALVVAAEPLQTVQGVIMDRAEWVAANTVEPSAGGDQKAGGRGSGFARALKAPFKAIGRLFGRGKKDDSKLARISEKDAKNFESVPGTQVNGTQLYRTTGATDAASAGNAPEIPTTTNQSAVNPNSPQTLETIAPDHLEQGRTLLNNHDLNAAIAELSRAASANPNLSEASTLLGVAYWRKGLRDLAERSFETAVNLNKNDAQNLNNLGFLLYENGDYENATKYLKRAARLSPNDPRIWNNLGLAQSERGHFDDAYESFARAQGEYKGHLNVAARLERAGNSKKAIKHLEKAVALQPNSPEVLARLVILYHDKGDEKLAQSARTSLDRLRTLANATVK